MECIAIETYFASVGGTQTFITQYIDQGTEKRRDYWETLIQTAHSYWQ